MGSLSEQLNSLNTQIEDLSVKIKTARKIQKYQSVIDELKTLSGRKKSRFEKEHQTEISGHNQALKQMKEFFPDGHFPTPDSIDKKRNALIQERSEKNKEYSDLKSTVAELNYARQTLADYIRNERNVQEMKRKKGDLE